MTSNLELRLIGGPTPDGQIRFRDLAALAEALQEVSLRIGRYSTNAAGPGRTKQFMEELTELRLKGVTDGSTRLIVSRGPTDQLDISLSERQLVDDRFWELIAAVGEDTRPDWVGDLIAESAAKLVAALKTAAAEVEVIAPGRSPVHISAERIHRETWQVTSTQSHDAVTFAGRLYAVNLNTHRLQVQDDVGNQVALPRVLNDTEVSKLIGTHVTVTGAPELDARGCLVYIHDAAIVAAPDPLGETVVPGAVSLDEILRTAPGPDPDGGIELTDEEFASFFEAARG